MTDRDYLDWLAGFPAQHPVVFGMVWLFFVVLAWITISAVIHARPRISWKNGERSGEIDFPDRKGKVDQK